MKKTKSIVLALVFMTAIAACDNPDNQWISGNVPGVKSRDSVVNGRAYRFYGGYWYPLYGGRINPGMYSGGTTSEISSPSFHSSMRSGGFGASAHSSGYSSHSSFGG